MIRHRLIHRRRWIGYISFALFAVLLLVTLLAPIIRPPDWERRVFWFPDSTRTAMHAEFRFVPGRETPREEFHLYIKEMMLGPSRMGSVPYIPRDVTLNSVILVDRNRLFLDFSPNLVVRSGEVEFSLEDITGMVKRNVIHKFPFLHEIVITVGGQIPNVPRFGNPALTKDRGTL